MIKTEMDKIDELLTRGVANIIPGHTQLEKVLRSGKKLNVYLGIDPTSIHLHLGNAVPLRKLQNFADLGHQVTFLIGDFTALIGDTSDKDAERPVLTYGQIESNFQTYKTQASKLLNFDQIQVKHNSDWLKKLNFEDVVKLTRHFSLNDFISRELIKKRLTEGKSVSLPEVLYPVMQGYDSWIMDTDIQIGGTDQTFNMQAGRTLQKILRRGKESFVLSFEFLEGTDGRKMSKSWNNGIWLDDSSDDIFGKVMSIKDELTDRYFALATNLPISNIQDLTSRIKNPMDLKKRLAHQIVTELHDKTAADTAQANFESTFQQGQTPTDIPSISISNLKSKTVVDVLVESGLASSKSEARRLIDQGGVKVDGNTISNFKFQISNSAVVSVGSRKFIRLT